MVIDASIAVKWVAEEADSERAIQLIGDHELGAPTLIYAEVANALWKLQRRGWMSSARCDRVDDGLSWTVPERDLAPAAHALAVDLDHPVYDCFYLALAIVRDLPLMTANERFLREIGRASCRERV